MIKLISIAFILTSVMFSQVYDIGDQVSISDQLTEFEVCYGDYPTANLKLADFNGDLNGGNYKVTFLDLHDPT